MFRLHSKIHAMNPAASYPRAQLLSTGQILPLLPVTHRVHSQHQVASLKLAAVQGPTREVGLIRGLLPVLERRL